MKTFNDLYYSNEFKFTSSVHISINGVHEFTGELVDPAFEFEYYYMRMQSAIYDWYSDRWYINLVK